jgi:peptidoglycan/LPS O-acetylase OafA/YrhL
MTTQIRTLENHLTYLDGFRSLAANWVLCAHIMIWGGWYGLPLPDAKIAVDLFMVLSGFLMLHIFESRRGGVTVGVDGFLSFLCRRFFRIAPVYYVALIFSVLIGPQIEDGCRALQAANPHWWKHSVYNHLTLDHSWTSLLLHVTFLFGFVPKFASCVGLPDWSIALEMQFYVCFPILLMLFRKVGPLASSLVIVWMGKQSLRLFDASAFPEPCFLPLKIDVFLIGMLLNCSVRNIGSRSPASILEFLAAIWIASFHSMLLAAFVVAIAICACDSVAAEPIIRYPGRILNRLLGNRLTRFLADTSYAVYLVHGFFISVVGGWLVRDEVLGSLRPVFRTAILGMATTVLSYAVAWVVHHYIELPFIRVGRRMVDISGPHSMSIVKDSV